jgi:hypothetical protein
MEKLIEDLKNKYIQKALRKKYYDNDDIKMEQTIEDLKNKDIQIELRKKYYDDMPSERKDLWEKDRDKSILCYCNRFTYKKNKVLERHIKKQNHQEFCVKIKNEEKIIKEKNPEYLFHDGEFFYKNQLIKYYYFTGI